MNSLATLPQLISNSASALTKNLFSGSRIIGMQARHLSPNIIVCSYLVVKNTNRKSDFAPDIRELRAMGVSAKQISELLRISRSYVYKFLK